MQLKDLADIKLQRHLPWDMENCEIHAFCDASEKGYAAVVYLRCVISQDIAVRLCCAKSKVAPLKCLTIPRLELCGANLLASLLEGLFQAIPSAQRLKVFAWTDSTVVLSWLSSPAHRWKTFVANRVSYIQSIIPPTSWHHIRSELNPADCASRGLLPPQLCQHPLWWAGPKFLKLPHTEWTFNQPRENSLELVHEEKLQTFVLNIPFEESSVLKYLLTKHSTFDKIQRILAYMLRFLQVGKPKESRNYGSLICSELQIATNTLIKLVQMETLQEELQSLKKGRGASKSLRHLNPFLDKDGAIRVGGRLIHSQLKFDNKHPLLLPGKHLLTKLVIEHFHKKYLHPGAQTLHYLLSQQFWIIGGRRAVRSQVSKCQSCFRLNPKGYQPPMGDLPKSRISQVKPFSVVGVDYGGPFAVTLSKARGCKTRKAYICLFVCYATKAIHLELASDLSTETFLAALRRFMSRRGRCSQLHSDCGTNFTGAAKELTKIMKSAAEQEGIKWLFNPPSAPHFGGIWEAGIKSTKTHLYRVIGEQILSYEEFNTLLVQIEAVLNSRPLCPTSSDPTDLRSLTPGHFLTLEPLGALPDEDYSDVPLNRLKRWQLIQRLQQDFWKRWHDEYLHTLQQRKKWFGDKPEVHIGTLVVIKNELLPPLRWALGRITEVYPDKNGVIRVATVKTATGIFRRPLVKLCPLPNQ